MNIFVVSDDFALPMAITDPPQGLTSLNAACCGACHLQIYREWATSMHARAWTDPYYQVDLIFDGNQQICLNCHIPLRNQQENRVLGFKDTARFKPILQKNPNFNTDLQKEGVTCVVCHVRNNIIIGPYADADSPHASRFDPEMTNGIGICRRCHVVSGKRWDTFFNMPPCGTVSEIKKGKTVTVDCTGCHMPGINRPAADGGKNRQSSYHLWRGGHDRETVQKALQARLAVGREGKNHTANLRLTNIGADHFLPTGTPDRHLSVLFSLTDPSGQLIKNKSYTLKRTIMWRPFIIDLRDTRLIKNIPVIFSFNWNGDSLPEGSILTVTIRYHLLDERRRKRIGYRNTTPISYLVFQQIIPLPK